MGVQNTPKSSNMRISLVLVVIFLIISSIVTWYAYDFSNRVQSSPKLYATKTITMVKKYVEFNISHDKYVRLDYRPGEPKCKRRERLICKFLDPFHGAKVHRDEASGSMVYSHCETDTERSLVVKTNYRFTLCHPVLYSVGNKEIVRYFVKFYQDLGFEHFFFYVTDLKNVVEINFANVTWFHVPWIDERTTFYHGQMWTIHHCLYYNRVMGNEWSLFLDVDEYLVDGNGEKIQNFTDWVDKMSSYGDYSALTFGNSYRKIEDAREIDPDAELIHRFEKKLKPFCRQANFNKNRCASWMGKRKYLVRNEVTDGMRVHTTLTIRGCSEKTFEPYDVDARHYIMNHLRGCMQFEGSPWGKGKKKVW